MWHPSAEKIDRQRCMDAKSKADHVAETFRSKYKIEETELNEYTLLEIPRYQRQEGLALVVESKAEKLLDKMDADSATGPDELPANC